MSFVRPELAERLRPWREAAVWAAVAAAGLIVALRGWQVGGLLAMVVGTAAAGAGAALLVTAVRRQRLHGREPEEGVVAIREGRLGYFGPTGGGFVDLDALERVEILRAGDRTAWRLVGADGAVLDIPTGARGADGVYDALAGFAPLDADALDAALRPRAAGRFPIWTRSGDRPSGRLR